MRLKHLPLAVAIIVAASITGCQRESRTIISHDQVFAQLDTEVVEALSSNPFLQEWTTPFGAPPFSEIEEAHFMPAFKFAMKQQLMEIDAITASEAKATFANTIAPLAHSGETLAKVSGVFSNLSSAETNDELIQIAQELSPLRTAHNDGIYQNDMLFQRVKAVHESMGSLKLKPEESMLIKEFYRRFVRSGALLDEAQKARLREINSELGLLSLKFGNNRLKEDNAYGLVVTNRNDLNGLPENAIAAAADEAAARGLSAGNWVFTHKWPSLWPFMQYCQNRNLRRQILEAYAERCNKGNETDNKEVIRQMVTLRLEKANMLGFPTWAHHQHDVAMAENPENVYGLLNQLWPAALEKAEEEKADLQALFEKDFPGQKLQAWDWRYYVEKVKKEKFDLDEEELRQYFALENVEKGAFEVCRRLWGLTFTQVTNVPVYHQEVKAFEVKDANGSHIGLLYMDYHPRPGKGAGAWMSNYRPQWKDGKTNIRPIVVNVGNYSRATGDMPALLTMDEANTLFHELGHGLHGLLSQCTYRPTSGTSVPTDFVELPSQIMEHWAFEPEVMKMYARHWQTGEEIPQSLIDKIVNAGTFNQGFATTEFLAAALLDLDYHTITDPTAVENIAAFEKQSLEKMGLIPEILPRYRTTYFAHITGGYSAGYYSYIWAEVLDADAFQAFKEKGDIFHQATAKSFRTNILEAGGSRPAMEMYKAFRGSEPTIDALLENRGLKK